jgi:sialic acid synthase SpsE
MANEEYILNAYNILKKKEPLGILQCTSSYPTPLYDVNLNVIHRLNTIFPNDIIGFSDHTLGHHISLGAVALGASIVEKHFTLDNNFKGSDHLCALNPESLKVFVSQCRDIERAMGSKNKIIQQSEKSCITKLCKSVVANCYIPIHTIITKDMITTKSPATGIPAYFYNSIIGKQAKTNILTNTAIQWTDVNDTIDIM